VPVCAQKKKFRRQLFLQLDAFEPGEQIDFFDNVLQICLMIVTMAPQWAPAVGV
jgi:hypothetical protein